MIPVKKNSILDIVKLGKNVGKLWYYWKILILSMVSRWKNCKKISIRAENIYIADEYSSITKVKHFFCQRNLQKAVQFTINSYLSCSISLPIYPIRQPLDVCLHHQAPLLLLVMYSNQTLSNLHCELDVHSYQALSKSCPIHNVLWMEFGHYMRIPPKRYPIARGHPTACVSTVIIG